MNRGDWRLLAAALRGRSQRPDISGDNFHLLSALASVALDMSENAAGEENECRECGAKVEQRGPGYWFTQHAKDCRSLPQPSNG